MSKQAYRFDLIAATYSTAGASYTKPWSVTLEEGDPRISEFRNNGCFKETPVMLPEPPPPKEETLSFTKESPTGDIPNIASKTKEALIEAGYETIGEILDASEEDLTEIEGIGGKTADAIIFACQEALGLVKEEEEE